MKLVFVFVFYKKLKFYCLFYMYEKEKVTHVTVNIERKDNSCNSNKKESFKKRNKHKK